MVTMWRCCDWFMCCSMAAMVDVFPLPVTPVTRISPDLYSVSRPSASGRPSCSSVGIANGITRITIMNEERCRRMLTRKRPTPGMPQEQS